MLIPTDPPHPDWLPPKPLRSRWWFWLFVPVAAYAAWILPTYVGVAMILFILVVIRYGDRV